MLSFIKPPVPSKKEVKMIAQDTAKIGAPSKLCGGKKKADIGVSYSGTECLSSPECCLGSFFSPAAIRLIIEDRHR